MRWYTSLLGRKATIKTVKQVWQELAITNTRVIELLQGKTTRWVVCWSHTDEGIAARAAQAAKKARTSGRATLQTNDAVAVFHACDEALRRAGEWKVRGEVSRFSLAATNVQNNALSFEITMLQPRSGVLQVELHAKVCRNCCCCRCCCRYYCMLLMNDT